LHHWRHLFLVSVGDVLQVYKTPVFELPIAPAGEQNAPGDTSCPFTDGVGVGGTGVGVGVGRAKSNSGRLTATEVAIHSP